MTHFIAVLSTPRSGTTHLCANILSRRKKLLYLWEIFHHVPHENFANFAAEFNSYDEFRETILTQPQRTLLKLVSRYESEIALFKLFPEHVDDAAFCQISKFVTLFIVLSRNPLSTWISGKVATLLGQWHSVKTEEFKVRWDPTEFLEFAINELTYLVRRREAIVASSVPYMELSYSNLIDPKMNGQVLWKEIGLIAPALKITFSERVKDSAVRLLSLENKNHIQFLKQDHRRPIDRIENRGEAIRDLTDWGLTTLFSEAVELDQPSLLAKLIETRLRLNLPG